MKKSLVSVLSIALFAMSSGVASAQYYSYPTPTQGVACTNVSTTLSYGSRGGQVSLLQNFLSRQGYAGSGSWMVTGYFGTATLTALRMYQSGHNLPVSGITDAATRAAIAQASCGGTTPIYTTPTNPITTTPITPCINYAGYNPNTVWNYANGTSQYPYCGSYNQTTPTISYLTQTAGGVGTWVSVVGMGFSTSNNTVHFGSAVISGLMSPDGTSLSFQVPAQLVGYGNQAITLGTYPVSVTNAAGYTSTAVPFTVTSLASGNAPTISAVSGPSSLVTGQTATWTVTVTNPAGTLTTVSVNWGDSSVYNNTNTAPSQQIVSSGTQTFSFTHTYYAAGSYTATFTVSSSGGSNLSSQTITVVNSGNSNPGASAAISVISPTSASIGTSVTIYGSGFSASGNIVRFGSGAITNLSSSNNGATIVFTVPSYLTPYCVSGYACPQYAQMITPGTYAVSVQNANGSVSNSVTIAIQ